MNNRIPYKTWLKDLEKARDHGRTSPWLLKALTAIIEALATKDLNLACQLTAVKSHICGDMAIERYAFREDSEYNEKALGHSLYVMLDIIHHDIAWKLDTIPSGMVIVRREGIQDFQLKKIRHPVLNQIRKEHERNVNNTRRRK